MVAISRNAAALTASATPICDEHGKSCDKWGELSHQRGGNEPKEADRTYELAAGTFLIPSSVTVAEFLMDWLPKQCSKHKC